MPTSKSYQENMDVIRLQAIKQLGEIIEEYKKVKGKYPFQTNSSIPVMVYFARSSKYVRPVPNTITKTPNQFKTEVESVLKRQLQIPIEPQKVPNSSRPVFYMYMVNPKYYYVAVHTYNNYSFARKVDDHYYKTEISNEEYPPSKIWTYKQLMSNPDYKEAISRGMFGTK